MPEVFFAGPVGRIEGRYSQSKNQKAPLALLLHPHPLHGGTMNNKVIYNLYTNLVNHGFTVLRINSRGVGRSQGSFDNGIGEMVDSATALDWLKHNNPLHEKTLIAGFSFGAWISTELIMRRPDIDEFISVAPPVNKYDFSFFSPCPIPGIIIQGDQDSIVPEESVLDLVNRISKQGSIKIQYKVIQGADHFFRNKITDLEKIVSEYLAEKFETQNFVTANLEDIAETISEKKRQKMFLD